MLIEIPGTGWREIKPSLLAPDNYHVLYNDNMAIECFYLGLVSIGLTTVNIICIIIMAYVVLKVVHGIFAHKVTICCVADQRGYSCHRAVITDKSVLERRRKDRS